MASKGRLLQRDPRANDSISFHRVRSPRVAWRRRSHVIPRMIATTRRRRKGHGRTCPELKIAVWDEPRSGRAHAAAVKASMGRTGTGVRARAHHTMPSTPLRAPRMAPRATTDTDRCAASDAKYNGMPNVAVPEQELVTRCSGRQALQLRKAPLDGEPALRRELAGPHLLVLQGGDDF